MPFSSRVSPNKTAGFTLIELLISLAVAGTILTVGTQLMVGAAKTQAREEVTVPVQQSVRGAMEALSIDLREAAGPRVIYSGAPLPDTASYQSTNSQITVVHLNPANVFHVVAPTTYATGTGLAYTPSPAHSTTAINSPNDFSNACSDVFKGGEYAIFANNLSYAWAKAAASPCTAVGPATTLNHSMLGSYTWTPDARMSAIDVTQYRLATVAGTPSLVRSSILGGVATDQVVAFDITGFTINYSADGVTFSPTPTAAPVAVKVQITGQTSVARNGMTTSPFSLTEVIFMRQTTITKPAGT